MASFIITGNCDDVCARLKNTLRASDAGFDARLQATFKTNAKQPAKLVSPPPAKPVSPPPAKPVSPPPARQRAAAAPAADARSGFGSGASLSLTRRSDDAGNMRSRLRSSRRGS